MEKSRVNRLPQVAAIMGGAIIAVAAVPVASQGITGTDPVETDFAPYALGRANEDVAAHFDAPWRTDTIRLTVGGMIQNYGQMEYKVTMDEGDVLLYTWTASDDIYYEFHGHPLSPDGTYGDAMLYRDEDGSQSHGFVRAPLQGIHGWYFVNDSFDAPVEIELTLAGTYDLEPGIIGASR
ncbi:hypothetical protein [Pelagibacterium halotolerans]|uniref:Uncharacterized protein n=1 Tax=Pelagibacterium halotolerans (strain DSM 22347 / JCM 15775 / CGMCC 1.7692 / B2) TaxID=1082931 RepID=G4R728_PELHB|nr:hypothetical protein [Pelagibacterium halotolerans]AEQ50182.1 hypothetical protein KKY_135 [Pelagibacterium halotolerans B2]SEA49985.1 hypothetical protein SAMN05428936_104218 [Pelagibacterium halotolerans]